MFLPDFKAVWDGNFDVLGAHIGSDTYCKEHAQERVQVAVKLLKSIGELPDPQVALKLLRSCGSFCRVVLSACNVNPDTHKDSLSNFVEEVMECFFQFSGIRPEDDSWSQATLPTSLGGLGLCSILRHSTATCLAPRSQCVKLCRQLDPQHTFQDSPG